MAKQKKRSSGSASRGKDTTESEADDRTQQQATDLTAMTKPSLVKKLLADFRRTRATIAEMSGDLGKAIATAVEHNYLNRKAFNMCKALDRLEPEKLAETMAHFRYYYDVSGLEKREESVGRLPMGDQPGETDEEETDPPQKNGKGKIPGTGVTSSFGRKMAESQGKPEGSFPRAVPETAGADQGGKLN